MTMKILNNSSPYYFFFLLLIIVSCLSCSLVVVDADTCSSFNYTEGSSYVDSLREVASALLNASSFVLYHNVSSTSNSTRQAAYGMFQCRGDVSLQVCFSCVNTTINRAMKETCPASMGANTREDACHIHYDNNSALFDGSSPDNNAIWYYVWNTNQITDVTYQSDVMTALQNVTAAAPSNPNYYASIQVGYVYALAQCDGYLSFSQCKTCLSPVSDVLTHLNKSQGGTIFYTSCFYGYDNHLFFSIPPPPPSPSTAPISYPDQQPSPFSLPSLQPPPIVPNSSASDNNNVSSAMPIGVIAGGTVGGILFVGLFIWALLFFYGRKKSKAAPSVKGLLDDDMRPLFLDPVIHFSYEVLKAATQDFHPQNKIGAGGFGPVYKGILANGVEVAIKKLSTNSSQGKSEFINEVSIITSVQHKNLIKLYGCCVDGLERMLVYEYLPNKSLDKFIFDNEDSGNNNVEFLDWKTRFDIILGIARGLAYLHQDSQVRIIHRDIKASNILLDQDLTPKIADFGLAKLFSHGITHITGSRVAGTLGYLSPEYAIHGQLTEKVDVYSFGIVCLEILSGRRNADLPQPPERACLLDLAWRCYDEGQQMQLLDPKLSTMNHNTPIEEVIRVGHVALLCLQSPPEERPSMTTVVQMLSGQSQILEIPKMPHFAVGNSGDKVVVSSSHHNNLSQTSTPCSNVTGR